MASAVLCQIAANITRPLVSYKILALGGDAIIVGLTSAAYALIPMAAAIWLGRVTDRRNSLRGLLTIGALLLAAAPLVLFASSSLIVIASASALLGLGQLCFTIAGQSALARFVSVHHIDAAFGLFTASFAVGQMVGPLLAGLAISSPDGAAATFRLAEVNTALFIAGAISSLAIPFAYGTVIRGDPADVSNTHASRPDCLSKLLRYPTVRSNLAASLALLTTTDILVAFLPLLGEEQGVAPVVVGALLAVRAAASIASRLVLPLLIKRWARSSLVTASLVGAGTSLAVLPLVFPSPWAAAAVLIIGGFFLGLGQPITMTLVTQAVPHRSRGAALALRLLANRMGQVSLPAAAGFLAAPVGPSGALWLSCAVLAAACVRRPHDGPR